MMTEASVRPTESRAAVFLRDQCSEPARFGQRIDKGFGIATRFVDLAKVFAGKLLAQIANGFANVLERILLRRLHGNRVRKKTVVIKGPAIRRSGVQAVR
jgi:hypothetical protein